MNGYLQNREMVKLANNSTMTMQAASLLTNKLTESELVEILGWFFHANRQQEYKSGSERGLGRPDRRY